MVLITLTRSSHHLLNSTLRQKHGRKKLQNSPFLTDFPTLSGGRRPQLNFTGKNNLSLAILQLTIHQKIGRLGINPCGILGLGGRNLGLCGYPGGRNILYGLGPRIAKFGPGGLNLFRTGMFGCGKRGLIGSRSKLL